MKKRITFLIRSLENGGAERQLVTLVEALDKDKFDVSLICFYGGGVLEKQIEKNSQVKFLSLEKKGRWDIFEFWNKLFLYIKELQPDILYGYLGASHLMTIFLKIFYPSTVMVWGVRSSYVDLSQYDWLENLIFKLQCVLSHFSNLIIVNSHAGRNYHLAHGFPDSKMIVIPNGIDTEKYQPKPELRAKVRAEWDIATEAVLIGRIGRLDPMKDYPTFLKAAALFYNKRKDARFVCVGSGTNHYLDELLQLAEQLGISEQVIWAGSRSDMLAVYSALDIGCSSSYGEGFPNVIGEAMACGIPCVVTDVGDSAWIVGDTGIVVPPQDPKALAEGWLSCLERDMTEMAQKARMRILENFSVKHLVHQTTEVLWQKV